MAVTHSLPYWLIRWWCCWLLRYSVQSIIIRSVDDGMMILYWYDWWWPDMFCYSDDDWSTNYVLTDIQYSVCDCDTCGTVFTIWCWYVPHLHSLLQRKYFCLEVRVFDTIPVLCLCVVSNRSGGVRSFLYPSPRLRFSLLGTFAAVLLTCASVFCLFIFCGIWWWIPCCCCLMILWCSVRLLLPFLMCLFFSIHYGISGMILHCLFVVDDTGGSAIVVHCSVVGSTIAIVVCIVDLLLFGKWYCVIMLFCLIRCCCCDM